MTYTEFICHQLNDFPTGQPVYTGDIAEKLAAEYGLQHKEAAAATAVAFKRIMDDAILPNLRFFQKGIYYFTAVTPFGEVGIDKERLIAVKHPDKVKSSCFKGHMQCYCLSQITCTYKYCFSVIIYT